LQLAIFDALPRSPVSQNRAPYYRVLDTCLAREVPLLVERLRGSGLLTQRELDTMEKVLLFVMQFRSAFFYFIFWFCFF
jgi:hypothetical protein